MSSATLKQKLQAALPLAREFQGICFRVVDTFRVSQGQALSPEGSRLHGGRYNPPGEFGVLYLSLELETCLAELAYYGIYPEDLPPEAKTKITVGVKLGQVLDLTDPAIQKALGVDETDLKIEWLAIQRAGGTALPQAIGRLARELGFEALLVPSARHTGKNLVVLRPDSLSAGFHLTELNQEIL